METNYEKKYIKYKLKYLEAKRLRDSKQKNQESETNLCKYCMTGG